jgi:hypothetical protein
MRKRFRQRSAFIGQAALLFVALFLIVDIAQGQSGRKLPNRGEPAPPVPSTPEAKPEAAPPDKTSKPGTRVHVVRDLSMSYDRYSLDIVMKACADRLREAVGTSVGGEMNRKEAGDYAKKSPETYVLWMESDYDRMSGTSGQSQYRDHHIFNFTLYAPVTGKPKTSGRAYQADCRRRTQVGGVGLPLPVPTGPAGAEYALRECGKEIADRVLNSVIPVRPGRI